MTLLPLDQQELCLTFEHRKIVYLYLASFNISIRITLCHFFGCVWGLLWHTAGRGRCSAGSQHPTSQQLSSSECIFALIKMEIQALIHLPAFQNKLQLWMCSRSLSPKSSSPPVHLLPGLLQQKALTAGAWTEGEDPLRPQQASISLFRLYSRVEVSDLGPRWLIHPCTVPFAVHSLSLMKCGGAEATLHKPSGTVCYHWQTAIKFQTGMEEQCGNYWKRHGIAWRERTMLQAAFTPYLPPPASYRPASLTYRLAKPHWGSQIICVIKFILAMRTRPPSFTQEKNRVLCQNSTDGHV